MNYSFFSRIRDLLFLCILLFLVKTSFERTKTFINAHTQSIIHELNPNFIDSIYNAQRQLHFFEQHPTYGIEYAAIIADIKSKLNVIEEKYTTNSPGIMLLGPLGSAAIVTKEEKLQKKLLTILNDLNQILHTINNKKDDFQYIETIHMALKSNKKLLQSITG
jgi:hypothetical protein